MLSLDSVVEHFQILAGDMASCQQRTSLNPDSDVCSLTPDSHRQQVKPLTPDSDRRRQETEPEKQTKRLKNTRESYCLNSYSCESGKINRLSVLIAPN